MRGARAALGAAIALTACRGIIGYKSIALDLDAAHDGMAGDAACTTAPRVLFTTDKPLTTVFAGAGYVYAQIGLPSAIAAPDGAIGDSTSNSGLVGCPLTGCGGSPALVKDFTTIVDAAVWGSAAASEAGLTYTLPSELLDGGVTEAGAGVVILAQGSGGNPEPLASHLDYPYLVTLQGANVYWTNDPSIVSGSVVPWSVVASPIASPQPTTLMHGFTGNGYSTSTTALFSDATNVYVAAIDSTGATGLFVCPLLQPGGGGCHGRPIELLSTQSADSFASDGKDIYQAVNVSPGGTIVKYDIVTHAPTTLATNLVNPSNIAVDAFNVYWSPAMGGVIYYLPKDGSAGASLLVCGLTNVTGIAVQSGRVYFAAADTANGSRWEVASVAAPPAGS